MSKKQTSQNRDALTGAYTRAALDSMLPEFLKKAQQSGEPFSVLMLDIDHFKSINDGFGHARGDQALIEFTRRLESMARETDMVFRFGGDEFLMLVQSGKAQAARLAQRLIDGVHNTPFSGDPPLVVSTCVGVATYPEDGDTAEELFSTADERQYNAKRAGRGRAVSDSQGLNLSQAELEEPPRLLERDTALDGLKDFLAELPNAASGTLVINSLPGSGRTRFFTEVASAARMQGYAVLTLKGKSAVKNRLYGALVDALLDWQDIKTPFDLRSSHPAAGLDVFEETVLDVLSAGQFKGLLVTLDDLPQIDQSSRALLRSLCSRAANWGHPKPGKDHTAQCLGIVYADARADAPQPPLCEARLQLVIDLEPLSEEALRIWLRHSLHWEAPQPFVEWLHHVTHGLPALIKNATHYMTRQNILQPSPQGGWIFPPNLNEAMLAEQISAPPPKVHHNLPLNNEEFIGRELELVQLKNLILSQNLVTLVSSAGQGKTALAVQAALESLEHFRDGVYYVSLESVHTLIQVVNRVANAFGFIFSQGDDPLKQLANALSRKLSLLILDNQDHIVDKMPLLEELSRSCPELHTLVLSATPLDFPNEVIFELQGMDYPGEAVQDGFQRFEAVQYFGFKARRADPNFEVNRANAMDVGRICRLMQGAPLGVGMAAAWVHFFSCRQIADRMQTSFDLLPIGSHKDSDRTRGLLSFYDSFWDLLYDNERKTVGRLAIFQDDFSHESARSIAGASPFMLDALATRSLLQRVPPNRYRIQALLRQYLGEKLDRWPTVWPNTRQAHSRYYLDMLIQKESDLKGSNQLFALEQISIDIDNIRAAWRWAIESEDMNKLVRAADSLFYFYYIRSWFREGEETFDRLIEHEPEMPRSDAARLLLGKALTYRGWFRFLLDEPLQAQEDFKQAGHVLQPLEDDIIPALRPAANQSLAYFYFYRSAMLINQKQTAQAAPLLEKSLELFRTRRDRFGISLCFNMRGRAAMLNGQHDAARQDFQEAIKIKRRLGDRWGIAFILEYLGQLESARGHTKAARRLLWESLSMRREISDHRGVGLSLDALGDLAAPTSPNEAARYYRLAIDAFQNVGNQPAVEALEQKLAQIAPPPEPAAG